ncbi:uncharacterized protein LOC130986849 [Salvia miltiorrhiza]|uniref:uncharacterized protein LOC130986849 n=1 Tax=Salvia miltiorrhiza TaxID=226208 RepID=UPI0025AC03A6|nr:uncharacterized protein LOC130986849 [Salvia miltiorrhiza]
MKPNSILNKEISIPYIPSHFFTKMEAALWKLEDKWNLSTQKSIAIFACASFFLIGICVAAGAWRRRRRESVHQEPLADDEVEPRRGLGSVRWSSWRRSSKWEESPMVVKREGQSHNSTAAVWQRPILMGEKCELPRFSGLILYDQRGTPLHQGIMCKQEMMPTPTTLRDLL